MKHKSMTLALLALGVLTVSASMFAQEGPDSAPAVKMGNGGEGARGMVMSFRTSMMADAAPVKGSPFCATVTNEHTQVFADGNRIHTTEDSLLCRDSQGRTRREAQLNLLGAVPQGNAPKFITIEDPVAGARYTLDTFAKVARKMRLVPPPLPPGEAGKGNVMIYQKMGPGDAALPEPPAGEPVVITKRLMLNGGPGGFGNEAPPNKEELGDQTINGIHATGTRMTTTIPAGKMGNEQPIKVVSENWYSPELKATVMTKHSDPWAGELTTQFSNVNTSEPDPSLFTVPSDYKIVDGKEPFMIKMQRQAPGPQPQN